MSTPKEIKEEFISAMSKEILSELEDKAAKEGRKLTFNDIESAVLMFRQRIGQDITNKIIKKQDSENSDKKKLS